MINIYIQNSKVDVEYNTSSEYNVLLPIFEAIATYKDKNFEFKKKEALKKYKPNSSRYKYIKEWDGMNRLYEHSKFEFSVGIGLLYPLIRTLTLTTHGVKFKITDMRDSNYDYIDFKMNASVILYDYQQKFIDEFMEKQNIIINAPTGSGKTVMGVEIMRQVGGVTVIIADAISYQKEWLNTLNKLFKTTMTFKKFNAITVGYQDGIPAFMLSTATSIVNSMKSKRKTPVHKDVREAIQNCTLLIYDEVHKAATNNGKNAVAIINARYTVGLSGTVMMREDGKDLEYIASIGQIVKVVDSDALVKDKKVVPVTIKFLPVSSISVGRLSYSDGYNLAITYNKYRNEKIYDSAVEFIEKGAQILIFVDYIDHAIELSRISGFEWTDSNDKNRFNKFEQLSNGELPVLICTYALASTGLNIPSLDALIFAGAGKSAIKFIQAKGRVMRIFKGKKKGHIIDFADRTKWFKDHAFKRFTIYQQSEGVVLNVKKTWLKNYV